MKRKISISFFVLALLSLGTTVTVEAGCDQQGVPFNGWCVPVYDAEGVQIDSICQNTIDPGGAKDCKIPPM